jgi:hypothetical protein
MRNRTRFTTALGGVLIVATLGPAVAAGRPIDADHRGEAMPPPTAPTVTTTIDRDLDLGSAAVGAAGATIVFMLTAAGTTAAVRRRHHAR